MRLMSCIRLHQHLVQFTTVPHFKVRHHHLTSEKGNFCGIRSSSHPLCIQDTWPPAHCSLYHFLLSHNQVTSLIPMFATHLAALVTEANKMVSESTKSYERKAPMQQTGQDWWKGLLRMGWLWRQPFGVKVTKD